MSQSRIARGAAEGAVAPPPDPAATSATRSASPWAAGLAAIRKFARPFVVIELSAIALVVIYFLSPGTRQACESLAALRVRGGLVFVALASAVAGGLLPELVKWLVSPRGSLLLRGRSREILFNFGFFALNGLVVDRFYALMAWLIGSRATVLTVMGKVAFDQFIFTPIWMVIIVALYVWRGAGFRPGPTWAVLRADLYRRRVVPLLLPNWAFWIPMTSAVYALPVPLQFLLFTLALAAWSLIMVFIAKG